MGISRLLAAALCLHVLPALCAPTETSKALFNGRDLTGWINVNGQPDIWIVRDGMIMTTGEPTSFLRTDRMYENFILEFDWKHAPRKDDKEGNSGLFIWGDPIPALTQGEFARAVEVQVLVGLEWRDKTGAITASSHGDVFSIWGASCMPDRPHPRAWQRSIPREFRAKGFGEWNYYRIVARDGAVTLAVNGKEVSGLTDCTPRKGYLALEAEGNPVAFRNFKLTELPSSHPPPEQVAMDGTGWRRLYNGRDLDGWREDAPTSGRWRAVDWRIIAGDPRASKATMLWSTDEYHDFELILDWRRTQATALTKAPILVRGEVIPDLVSAVPDQWNRLHLIVKGSRLDAALNDVTVIENLQMAGAPARGPIALLDHGEPIEFANLYLRELKAP